MTWPSGLSDADLVRMADVFDPSSGGADHRVSAALRELIALRARRAQDTPSDPAAWQCRWCGARAEGDEVHEGGALVPSCGAHGLDLVRAPGAVAAATTEDEDDPTEVVQDLALALFDEEPDLSAAQIGAQRLIALIDVEGWRLVPPAPSAGEDEATVERAARAVYAEVYPGWPWEDDDAAQGRDDCRRAARAALAAARGPRTQDGA